MKQLPMRDIYSSETKKKDESTYRHHTAVNKKTKSLYKFGQKKQNEFIATLLLNFKIITICVNGPFLTIYNSIVFFLHKFEFVEH